MTEDAGPALCSISVGASCIVVPLDRLTALSSVAKELAQSSSAEPTGTGDGQARLSISLDHLAICERVLVLLEQVLEHYSDGTPFRPYARATVASTLEEMLDPWAAGLLAPLPVQDVVHLERVAAFLCIQGIQDMACAYFDVNTRFHNSSLCKAYRASEFKAPETPLAAHLRKMWKSAEPQPVQRISGHMYGVECFAVCSDGQLASGARDGFVVLWDKVTGLSTHASQYCDAEISTIAVLPDGRIAANHGFRGAIDVHAADGRCITLPGHTSGVAALVVLPNGHLASASHDTFIRVWDTTGGAEACVRVLTGHTKAVVALAVLLDGRLASASHDCSIKLWDTASGECTATLKYTSNKVTVLAGLQDGRLAAGASDGSIHLWDTVSASFTVTFAGFKREVLALAVLSDGCLVAAASDNSIKVWDVVSGTCVSTLVEHADGVLAISALPGGRLAVGTLDGGIGIWTTLLGDWARACALHAAGVPERCMLRVLSDGM